MAARFFEKGGEIDRKWFLECSHILVDVMKAPFTYDDVEQMVQHLFGNGRLSTFRAVVTVCPESALTVAAWKEKIAETEKHDHEGISSVFHKAKRAITHKDGADEEEEEEWRVGYCFGLFHYLYRGTLATIEHMVR